MDLSSLGFTALGATLAFLATRRGASAREREANAIAQAEEQRVHALFMELTLARKKLELAVKARDNFLSVASHELRTPLTTLHLQVQSLLRNSRTGLLGQILPDKQTRKLEAIKKNIDRFAKRINEVLDVSRLTSEQLELDPERFDLAELLREKVAQYEDGEAARFGCALRLEAPPSFHGCWDRARTEQLVENLVGNALKYGHGSPVEISLREENGMAVIVVRDHGIGIAREEQERIFGQFERAVSDLHYGGMGLGLWIVRQILEAAGGTIEVESRPNEGAAFTIRMPTAIRTKRAQNA